MLVSVSPARADRRTTGTPVRAGSCADGIDEPVAVETRHQDVAEHEVRRLPADRLEGCLPVGHELDVVVVTEHLAEVGAQVGVVLRHDDPWPTGSRSRDRARGLPPLLRSSRLLPGLHLAQEVVDPAGGHRRGRARCAAAPAPAGRVGSRTVKVLPRPTSLVSVTVPPISSVSCSHHGETDAGPLVRAGAGHGGEPLEPREGALDVIRMDADTGVAHRDLDVVIDATHGEGDRTLGRVLHRVGQEVEHDALDHVAVEAPPRDRRRSRG